MAPTITAHRHLSIMRVALVLGLFATGSAFLLPQGPIQPLLARKGTNAALAQYFTAAAMTAQTAPLLDTRATEYLGASLDLTLLHSIVFVFFASSFAIGYGMRQILSARR